ncbi:sugar ABC transporter substrate-binding protein, partial [Clostridium perfringens]
MVDKNRKKKGWTALIAAALTLSTVLSACSGGKDPASASNDPSEGDQITISFETSVYAEEPHKKAIDALIAKYNESHPNVTIKVHGTDYENYWDKLTTE